MIYEKQQLYRAMQQNNVLYSKYIVRIRHTPMTYILGAKCKDGVVLIADRKITYPAGQVEYQDKLSRYYYPVVLGGAGSTPMLSNFADQVLRETQDITATSSISGAVFFNPPNVTEYPYYVDYNEVHKESRKNSDGSRSEI